MPILRNLATALLPCAIAILAASNACAAGPQVVAYVFPQEKTLQGTDIDAAHLTRVNYAFANIEKGRMVTGFTHDDQNYAYLVALKKQNPSLTVLVSVGGWLWSTNFSDVSLTPESRRVFIDSVMDFLNRYQLDGLDIDWEYPGLAGSGHPFRAEDKQNFTTLLKELRTRFDQTTRKTHHPLILTIAAGSSNEFLDHTEMDKDQRYLDTVNLMAYDFYEPDSDPITGHNAPLFASKADPKHASTDDAVKAFEKAGVPASKLLLGLPFYGHIWGQVPNVNHGLFQSGKLIPNTYASYNAITQNMLPESSSYTRYWDAEASVPYLYSADKQTFVSYEDPQSIAAKSAYINAHHLGGAMFWDYESDMSGTLLRALDESIHAAPHSGITDK